MGQLSQTMHRPWNTLLKKWGTPYPSLRSTKGKIPQRRGVAGFVAESSAAPAGFLFSTLWGAGNNGLRFRGPARKSWELGVLQRQRTVKALALHATSLGSTPGPRVVP